MAGTMTEMATIGSGIQLDANTGTQNSTSHLRRELSLYRCLQLLVDEYNGLFDSFQLLIHAASIIVTVLCVFGSLRTEGVIALVQAYFGAWLLTSYLQVIKSYSEIYRGSKALLVSLSARCADKNVGSSGGSSVAFGIGAGSHVIIARELKSLTELRIRAGSSVFYFDKQLVLTVIQIVVSQTVGLLLLR